MGDESQATSIYMEDRTAGAYLTQARTALLDCGRPRKLYGSWREAADSEREDRIDAHFLAQSRQLDKARTSILFSALAAEAYINGFLWEHLGSGDFDAVERLRTPDKYALGPELALGERLFDRGEDPMQSITALFKVRHALVHPKGKEIEVSGTDLMDPRFEKFNPNEAARFLVSVATAALVLARKSESRPHQIVKAIEDNKARLIAFGATLRDGLPEPPKSYGLTKLVRQKQEAAGQEPKRTLLGAQVERPDPLKPPRTVPQKPIELLDYLDQLPGTATGPIAPAEEPEAQ